MKKNQKKQQNKNETIVSVDLKIYSLEAVYGAAYLFLDKAYFYLEESPKSKIKVNIKGKEKLTEKKLENLKDEFLNELVNSDLRDRISKSNKKIREYILGRVMVSSLEQDSYKHLHKHQCEFQEYPKEIQSNGVGWSEDDLKKEFMEDFSLDWEKDPEKIAVPWEKKQENFVVPWREEKQKKKNIKSKKKVKTKNKKKIKKKKNHP